MTSHFKYDCGKPPRFECPYCGQLSKRKFNIQYHIRHKHPMKPSACTTSGYVQLVSTNSKKKLKKRDPLYNFHTGKFHCPNCNNGYGRRDTMLGHFRYECGKAPRYKCPYCSLCSKKTSNIYQHVRSLGPIMVERFRKSTVSRRQSYCRLTEPEEEIIINDVCYPCPKCTRIFYTLSGLSRHCRYECVDLPRFKCPYCDMHSKFTQAVYRHVRNKHQEMEVRFIKLY
ncbi:hypothetical protein M0802_013773 [Mischocyttarus mexicanus]|nr:hypothetical protein M0802_013773 [Mischocyttarus mexicanus]